MAAHTSRESSEPCRQQAWRGSEQIWPGSKCVASGFQKLFIRIFWARIVREHIVACNFFAVMDEAFCMAAHTHRRLMTQLEMTFMRSIVVFLFKVSYIGSCPTTTCKHV